MPPPSQPPKPLLRLCPKHGIVAGRDGRCVICHRGDQENARRGNWTGMVVALALIVAGVGGAVAWKTMSRKEASALPPDVHGANAAPVPPPQPPAPEEPPPPSTEDRQAAVRAAVQERRQRDIEAEMRQVPIKLYVDDKCALCDTARDFLKQEKLSFTEVNVGQDAEALEALRKKSGSATVPSLDVDGEMMVGFGPTLVLGAVRRAADRRVR